MAVLVRRQEGQTTISGASNTATVSTYTASQSVLLFTYTGGDDSAKLGAVKGNKTNSTTLTFLRDSSGGIDITVEWELLEFDADVTVQDFDIAGSTAGTQTISTITTAQSFVAPLGNNDNGNALGNDAYTKYWFNSSTQVGFAQYSAANSCAFQVVDYTGCDSYYYDKGASPWGTSWTQAITSVDVTLSMIAGSGRYQLLAAGGDDIYRLYFTSITANQSTQVTGACGGTGTATSDLAFWVVEFTDGTTVQSGTLSVTNAQTSNTATVSTTDETISSSFCSCAGSWWTFGTSDNSADAPEENFFTLVLTAATTLTATRAVASGNVTLQYMLNTWWTGGAADNAPFFGCNF